MSELARRTWDPDCRPSATLPDGPVDLWVVAFSEDGSLLGAAAATGPVVWHWAEGGLRCRYGPVHISVRREGITGEAVIAAVSQQARDYSPVFRIWLGRRHVRPGMILTITDGDIALNP